MTCGRDMVENGSNGPSWAVRSLLLLILAFKLSMVSPKEFNQQNAGLSLNYCCSRYPKNNQPVFGCFLYNPGKVLGFETTNPSGLVGFMNHQFGSISSIIISGDSVLLRTSPPVSKARSGRLRSLRSLVDRNFRIHKPQWKAEKKWRRCRRWLFWRHCWSSICFSKVGIPMDFSRGFDSPDVFLLRKGGMLQCLHKAMSPHHLQAQFGNQERPPKVEPLFWHDFRHKCWELDSLYFTSIFKIWMFFLCLKIEETSSLWPGELIVGWLLLVGCSPDELSPSTPSSTGPLPCRSTHVLPQEPPKQASHTPPSGIHGS